MAPTEFWKQIRSTIEEVVAVIWEDMEMTRRCNRQKRQIATKEEGLKSN
jgi:hypothetical protein